MTLRLFCALCGGLLVFAPALTARPPDVLRSAGAIPANLAGRFREPVGFQQSSSGQYFVFDRRAHTVFGIDQAQTSVWEIVQIGPEAGRIIDPIAFSVEPQGTFVVADAPNNRERIQIFTPAGFRIGGFTLPGRARNRVVLGGVVLNGISSLQYTGTSILMSQPDHGAIVSEYTLAGGVNRTFGSLRRTGHEDDRELHLALNSGLPLIDPQGGFFFVFQTGEPVFQKYDAAGQLVFERHIEGLEIDPVIAGLPTKWPTRKTDEGELPLVTPTIRTAAVDRAGNLWIAFVVPYTYVYDGDGDKARAVQFRATGIITPNSLFFGTNGRVLVTPGLNEYEAGPAGQAGKAGPAGPANVLFPAILPLPPILPFPAIPPLLPLPPTGPLPPIPPLQPTGLLPPVRPV
jgi:hypothetical protein